MNKKKLIIIIAVVAILVVLSFVVPWNYSVGSDCTILPNRESSKVVYAQTRGVLTEFDYRSGDTINKGEILGKLTNLELKDDIEQIESSLIETLAQQEVLEKQLLEKQQQIVSSQLRLQKIKNELNISNKGYSKLSNGSLPPELEMIKLRMEEAKRDYEKLADEESILKAGKTLPPSIMSLKERVEEAKAQMAYEKKSSEKNKHLAAVGAISKLDYENAKTRYETALHSYNNMKASYEDNLKQHHFNTLEAQNNYLAVKSEYNYQLNEYLKRYDGLSYDTQITGSDAVLTSQAFQTFKAQLKQNKVKIDALRKKQNIFKDKADKLTLRAPISGIIVEDNIQSMFGKPIDIGERICDITVLEKVLVTVSIDEKDVAEVKPGQDVKLKVKPLISHEFNGNVYKISPVSKYDQMKKRNVYEVDVLIDNPEGLLKPGMTGFAKIRTGLKPVSYIVLREVGHLLRAEYWFI